MTLTVRLSLLGAIAVTLLVASPAAFAGGCAQTVIDDWSDNARVDGSYAPGCYRSAIAALPEDLASYSSAADDIQRALQARLREIAEAQEPEGEPAPASGGADSPGGGSDSSGGGSTTGGGGSTAGGGSAGDEAKEPSEGSDDRRTQQADPEEETPAETVAPAEVPSTGPVAAPSAEAFGSDVGDGGSSLPVAVIALLAAVAVAGLAAAGWLVSRQLRRRS